MDCQSLLWVRPAYKRKAACPLGLALLLTCMHLQARKKVNKLDNLTTGKAVDALLNYETVKLFNNEQFEVQIHATQLVAISQP